MSRSPLVSIVVAVYNYGRYIDDALASLFEQPYRPIEVIVVDDGSTDDSGDRAEAHPDVTVIRQPNRGVSAARNAGIAASTGELITFLDADDRMYPASLVALVAFMVEHPDVAVAFPRQALRFEDGAEAPVWTEPDGLRGDPAGVPFSAGLFRTDVFAPFGWFDDELGFGEFFDLLAHLPRAESQIAYLDVVGVQRRVHDRNLTHNQGVHVANMLASLKSRLDRGRQ